MRKFTLQLLIIIFYANQSFAMFEYLAQHVKDNRCIYAVCGAALVAYTSSMVLTSAVQADDSIESLTGWPSCRCADMSIDDLRNMAEGYCWDSGVNAEIRANLFDMVDLSVAQVQHLLDNATEWKDAITVANGTHCMYAIFSNMNCLEYIKFITNSPCTL